MASDTVREAFAASPDDAWALVGDFEGIGSLFAGVQDVVADASTRTFSMMGMRITERLVARDDAARTLTYSVVDGVPVESHEATIAVEPSGEGCAISWSVTTVPAEAQPLFADTYQRALASLHGALG